MALPATSIEQVERAKSLEISYRQFHPVCILNDLETKRQIKIPFLSLFNKYKDFLSGIIHEVELPDPAAAYYRFKPKRVSLDLYGTVELWDTILILNDCISVSEFQPKKLKAYNPEYLKEYLNEILILEGLLD